MSNPDLYRWSRGKMDSHYFDDLISGIVNEDYWKQKAQVDFELFPEKLRLKFKITIYKD